MPEQSITVTITFSDESVEELRAFAKVTGRSLDYVLEDVLAVVKKGAMSSLKSHYQGIHAILTHADPKHRPVPRKVGVTTVVEKRASPRDLVIARCRLCGWGEEDWGRPCPQSPDGKHAVQIDLADEEVGG